MRVLLDTVYGVNKSRRIPTRTPKFRFYLKVKMFAVEVSNLHYSYKNQSEALKGINLKIPPNRITGILGPNGSGKSTLFKALSTQIRVPEGTTRVLGLDVAADPAGVRSVLGICFQSPSLDPLLTVEENLFLFGRLRGLGGHSLSLRVAEVLELFGITQRARDRIKTLSGGLARRVEIAKSLLVKPRVLLLDEPTTGLDPAARRDFWLELKNLARAQEISICVTTHLMEEAELCDDLVFISEGQICGQGTLEALKKDFGSFVISMKLSDSPANSNIFERVRTGLKDIRNIREDKRVLKFDSDSPEFHLGEILKNWGGNFEELNLGKPSLADVYFKKTGRSL